LAQLAKQNIDLSLLQKTGQQNLDSPITDEWITRNIKIDKTVAFGSKEYFALAKDPATRPFLQSGRNVIFEYKGEIIAVQAIEIKEETQQIQQSDSYSSGRQSTTKPIITRILEAIFNP
jgi:hypothetical protein